MPDPVRAHQEWLGLIQPVGLVVSPHAMVDAQIVLDAAERERWLTWRLTTGVADGEGRLADFLATARDILDWPVDTLAGAPGGPALPDHLRIALPELNDLLEPTFAVPDPREPDEWTMLVRVESDGTDLDRATTGGPSWTATPAERFERLLRETKVPIGLLVSDTVLRLMFAPSGESSGYLSFPVHSMGTPHGRPMFQAMYELLKGWRFSAACPEARSLPHLLRESRKYQNVVSTRLAEQVLGALYELTRGLQAADDAAGGRVVQETLSHARSDVYGGLLTTIMRLVFVLYAEERGMLSQDSVWVEHYGVGALFSRLRNDRARYPDTMDQRFGAWPRLLALFRMLHDGARHGRIVVPARAGDLFDPDRFPFLEGRPWATSRVMGDRLTNVPRVSDGTILRILERLLMLDEERLSYRALDVEQIGSVYEAMMGFEVRPALGRTIAVRPKSKKPGSPSHPVVNLDELFAKAGRERAKWLKDEADCELKSADAQLLSRATSIEEVLDAMESRKSPFTPQPVQLGGMILVPTEERRRSGSHYTPRELTEPIVVTTLRPLLADFGASPTPDQLLGLRICDPAMGSGAFLVGVCRYLGDRLVDAWKASAALPAIPPDEDPQLFARRLVAQQCVYGVDRNPHAVQLAKLSLWLVTLARDHPFTFLDHALRCGDSLVGLTRKQILAFHWEPTAQIWPHEVEISDRVRAAALKREQIEMMAATDDTAEKERLLDEADAGLGYVRLVGDAVVAAYFMEEKDRARAGRLVEHETVVGATVPNVVAGSRLEGISEHIRVQDPPVVPFHWEVEFPEIFGRANPGFDAMVGNPPFAGKNTLIASNPARYLDWLKQVHEGAHGNSDLVAHFFRRAYGLLRKGGCFGLIATNTIAQGDTRATGLRWLRHNGCTLYEARRRYAWPGVAAVVVSVVHGRRGAVAGPYLLDRRPVERITAFLFHAGGDDDPAQLPENAGKSFIGSYVLGMGFTFDDDNENATPITEMERLIAANPKNAEVVFPYIGGEEVNDSPTHAHRRYVINFGEMSEAEARAGWPELMRIVEEKVKPERLRLGDNPDARRRRTHWWQWGRRTPALDAAVAGMERVFVVARVSKHHSVAQLSSRIVYSEQLVVIAEREFAWFALLQARPHELWFRFFGSTHEDRPRYTPSDVVDTFPFPGVGITTGEIEQAGGAYYAYRAKLMVESSQGLTSTYNRFHDRDERDPAILKLRTLHDEMDRAVMDAYGWTDLRPTCDFFLDHEDDEDAESGRRRRKPWRYRWPDDVRDEVLARLLQLNAERSNAR